MTHQSKTLKLHPKAYDSLGIIHCGVPNEGRVVVCGKLVNLNDNDQYVFDKFDIKAERHGSEYIFTKLH